VRRVDESGDGDKASRPLMLRWATRSGIFTIDTTATVSSSPDPSVFCCSIVPRPSIAASAAACYLPSRMRCAMPILS